MVKWLSERKGLPMKRAVGFLLILLALLTAFGAASSDEASDLALIGKAREAADQAADIFSEREIIGLFISDEVMTDRVLSITDGWKQAGGIARAAVLTIPAAVVNTGVPAMLKGIGAPQGAVTHADWLASRVLLSADILLSGRDSIEWSAVASIASTTDVCVLEGYPAGFVSVLLDCGNEAPLALVSFRIGEDGAALIKTSFVRPSPVTETIFDNADRGIGALLGAVLPGTEGPGFSDVSAVLEGVTLSVYPDPGSGQK